MNGIARQASEGNVYCCWCSALFQPASISSTGSVECTRCQERHYLPAAIIQRLVESGVRASGGPYDHRYNESGQCRVCGYQRSDNAPGCPAKVEMAVYDVGEPLTNARDFRRAARELHAMLAPGGKYHEDMEP